MSCTTGCSTRTGPARWTSGRTTCSSRRRARSASPEDEIRHVLRTNRYADDVQRHTTDLLNVGATGVPAFVVDERVLVPGAAAPEAFEQVLDRLGYAPVHA